MIEDFNKQINKYFPTTGDNSELLFLLNKTSQLLCNWYSGSEDIGPLPREKIFEPSLPEENGCELNKLFDDINSLIYSSFNPAHPGSLAHLDPPPLSISIVGDLIAGALNNNLLAEELSPSISLLEERICKWFATKVGFTQNSGGIAASGGTLNNLNALVTARFNSGFASDQNASFIISEDAHVSFKKCATILGLKHENISVIETDNYGRMKVLSLIEEFKKIQNSSNKVFAVVATFGTTIRGAIDPINEISSFCRSKNIWLHIDGSIGGIFTLGKNKIIDNKALKNANSLTINPQKILGITKTSSLLLVNDIENLRDTFQTGLPYVDTSDGVLNRGELGVQGSRPAEIIKLWLGLRVLGSKGINEILDQSILKKSLFAEKLDKSKFDIISGPLHIVSFIPKNLSKEQSDSWTLQTKKLLLKNNFMISRPFYHGRYFLRVVLGNLNTEKTHIIKLIDFLNQQVL
tara:strand:- start:8730 stop:10121 length:1392 start_codon:yes stop_codon:yes gene_type:complete